jgi:hypothetical protein
MRNGLRFGVAKNLTVRSVDPKLAGRANLEAIAALAMLRCRIG